MQNQQIFRECFGGEHEQIHGGTEKTDRAGKRGTAADDFKICKGDYRIRRKAGDGVPYGKRNKKEPGRSFVPVQFFYEGFDFIPVLRRKVGEQTDKALLEGRAGFQKYAERKGQSLIRRAGNKHLADAVTQPRFGDIEFPADVHDRPVAGYAVALADHCDKWAGNMNALGKFGFGEAKFLDQKRQPFADSVHWYHLLSDMTIPR